MDINLSLEGARLLGASKLPTGSYNMQIMKVEIVPTTRDNKGLRIEYKVDDGDYASRPFSEVYNVKHDNSKAEEIGKNELFTLLTHCGHPNPTMLKNSDEIVGNMIRLAIEEKETEFKGDDGNMRKGTNSNVVARMPWDKDVPSVSGQPLTKPAENSETQSSPPANTSAPKGEGPKGPNPPPQKDPWA